MVKGGCVVSRRRFIQRAALLSGGLIMGSCGVPSDGETRQNQWFMPDEAEPHKRTWMAFGAAEEIWGAELLPEVRRNLGTIARTISLFEPVTMLVRENEVDIARSLVGSSVELIVAPLDDLWMRDTGPIFVRNEQGEKAGLVLNFNGWGKKQSYQHDARVAAFVAQSAGVRAIETDIVLEGGCIEVDGHGTAILTESCVLNNNRNPGVSKARMEEDLSRLFGLKKIIWLPGIKGKDITDGHTDFYVRFVGPGTVLAGFDPDPASFDHEVTKEHLEILRSSTDAAGRKLNITVLEGPQTVREEYETEDFAAGYIGYYVCNGAVIMQEFGDREADLAARKTLQNAYPDREVVQIPIDGIAAGGGSIHCATQQEPMG